MARVTYVGPHDAVSVALPFGGEVECKRNETVQVPDSLADSLLTQRTNWKAAKTATNPKVGEE